MASQLKLLNIYSKIQFVQSVRFWLCFGFLVMTSIHSDTVLQINMCGPDVVQLRAFHICESKFFKEKCFGKKYLLKFGELI